MAVEDKSLWFLLNLITMMEILIIIRIFLVNLRSATTETSFQENCISKKIFCCDLIFALERLLYNK